MAAQPKERTVAQGIVLRFEPGIHLSDEQFFQLCQQNCDLRLERTAEGDIVVMLPAGGATGAGARQWAPACHAAAVPAPKRTSHTILILKKSPDTRHPLG